MQLNSVYTGYKVHTTYQMYQIYPIHLLCIYGDVTFFFKVGYLHSYNPTDYGISADINSAIYMIMLHRYI